MSRACEQMRIIGVSSSAAVRLARFLLAWSADEPSTERETRVSVPLTHGEIGECIAVARETASRAMIEFREKRLIEVHGTMIHITNRFALTAYAHQLTTVILPQARTLKHSVSVSIMPPALPLHLFTIMSTTFRYARLTMGPERRLING